MIYIIIFFYSIFVHLSLEECMYKKVSFFVDLEQDVVLDPLKDNLDKLLWHVAILKKEESELKFLCSGTVVGSDHVVTAALCVESVASSELLVVAGLSLLHSPCHALENPHSVFTVAKKYYPYHQGNLDKHDLAVLKLESKATFRVPQITVLDEKDRYSKYCFTLGWGLHNQSSDSLRCPNPSFQESINSILYHARQSGPYLNNILDIRNVMGFSSMFLFQLSKMLDVLPVIPFNGLGSKYPSDETCSEDRVARLKVVTLSTKRPYKCLCRGTNRLCLYSKGVDNIDQQVDIGSPVFCKLKKQKTKSRTNQVNSNRFVLAGIIMDKETEEIHWLKYKSSINMISATNVTTFTEFILAVMLNKD